MAHLSEDEFYWFVQYQTTNDKKYLDKILNKFQVIIFGYAYSKLKEVDNAKEITQKTLIKLVQVLQKQKVENFTTLTKTIAKNLIIDYFRSANKTVYIDDQNFEKNSNQFMDFSDFDRLNQAIELDQKDTQLNHCLKTLTAYQQSCIIAFYYEDKSYKQIASETGLSFNDIKSHIQNAKRNLKLCLIAKGK